MEYVAFVAAYADTKLPDILAVPTDPFFVYGSVSFPIYVYVEFVPAVTYDVFFHFTGWFKDPSLCSG
jgi:hypothetical protein